MTRQLELADFMPWPETERASRNENRRVVLRRVRAVLANSIVNLDVYPVWTFEEKPVVARWHGGTAFAFREHRLALWCSVPIQLESEGVSSRMTLRAGEEAWLMIGLDEDPAGWSVSLCRELHAQTNAYWREWAGELAGCPSVREKLTRSAITVHLLAHAPNDAVVAAVTTSLPERIGGDRNYDYRYTWVRDASLSAAFLATQDRRARWPNIWSGCAISIRRSMRRSRSVTARMARRG